MLRRLAASAVAALASALHTDDLKQSFFSELQEAPVGTTAFVFDVGANDGEWSRSWAEACADAAAHGKRIERNRIERRLVEQRGCRFVVIVFAERTGGCSRAAAVIGRTLRPVDSKRPRLRRHRWAADARRGGHRR